MSFLKNSIQKFFVITPILIFSFILSSCDKGGETCIEADDFGEYQSIELQVKAKSGLCSLSNYESGEDNALSECIEITGPDDMTFSLSDILSSDEVIRGTYNFTNNDEINNCIAIQTANNPNDCQLNNDGIWTDDDEICLNYLDLVIDECKNRCVIECEEEYGNTYEPGWVGTTLKENNGIEISRDAQILIDVTGEITLSGAFSGDLSSSSVIISPKIYDIQKGFFATNATDSLNLTGKWCDNGEFLSCSTDSIVGLIGSENLKAEKEFLRRLLIIEKKQSSDLPMDFDFNSWTCNYTSNDSGEIVTNECGINYSLYSGDVVEGSLDGSVYDLLPENLSTSGGLIMEDVTSLNTDEFLEYTCSVDSGDYACIPNGPSSINGNIVGSSGNSITFGLSESGKLKFKILPSENVNGDEVAGSGSCNVLVVNNTTSDSGTFSVDANSSVWKMAVDNDTDANELEFRPGDNVSISISDAGATWTTENGDTVSCGQGLAVLKEKNVNVIVNKSGFVSFKILGSENTGSGDCNISARIINPGNDSSSDDYFEYNEDEEPISNLSVVANGDWYGEAFVRNGQRIVFDSSSFNDTWSYGGTEVKCSVGLAMKIEPRSAILCKGEDLEEFPNPKCITDTNDLLSCVVNRETICVESYNYCSESDYNACKENSASCSSNCAQCVEDLVAGVEPTQEISVTQCYDLENYTKKVSGKTSEDLSEYKLKSFNSDTGYGNAESASCYYEYIIDEISGESTLDFENTNCTISDFDVSDGSRVDFIVLEDTANFLDINNTTLYSNNYIGAYGYQISTVNVRKFRNGKFLEAVLCKEGPEDKTQCIGTNLDVDSPSVLEQILKIDKGTITTNSIETGSYEYEGDPSTYSIDNFGNIVNVVDNVDYYQHFRTVGEDESLRLSFKIHDPEEEIYGQTKQICTSSDPDDCEDYNVYYDNSGQYNVLIKVKDNNKNVTSLVSSVIDPVLALLDGKSIKTSDTLCNAGEYSPYLVCYKTNGDSCDYDTYAVGDPNNDCYKKCSVAEDAAGDVCTYVEVERGLLERVYSSLIGNAYYAVILNLSMILAITFYGFSFFIGMTSFKQTELLVKLIQIGFIYLLVSENGWTFFREYVVRFFKEGIDFLSFTLTAAFDVTGSLRTVTDYSDKSLLFQGVDEVISLFFSTPVNSKIWGLFFVSWFGWAYTILIYFSMLIYIIAVANALILYLTAQIFVSILLSLAPLFIIFLIFNQTKGMFDKWLGALISFAVQQIVVVATLGFFSMLIKEVFKMVLSYRVCWEPVWEMNIPYLGHLTLFHFYKVAGVASGASSDSVGALSPGIFHILFIYLIAATAKKFITFMAGFAEGIAGGIGAAGLAGRMTTGTEKLQNWAKGKGVGLIKSSGETIARRVGGVRSEEEKQTIENVAAQRQTQRMAMKKAGDKAVSEAQKSGELQKRTSEVSKFDSDIRKQTREQLASEKGENFKTFLSRIELMPESEKKNEELKKFDITIGGDKAFVDYQKKSIHKEAAVNKAIERGLSKDVAEKEYYSSRSDVESRIQDGGLVNRALGKIGNVGLGSKSEASKKESKGLEAQVKKLSDYEKTEQSSETVEREGAPTSTKNALSQEPTQSPELAKSQGPTQSKEPTDEQRFADAEEPS